MAASGTATAPWQLSLEDLELIAQGAGVLGSGGGGSTYLGRLLVLAALRRGQSITIIPYTGAAREALVVSVALVGAPVILAEKLTQGREVVQACAALEQHLGERAAAVVCYEIGGINSMLPLLLAAQRGLPVLDADAMGRAFPNLDQDTLGIYSATPVPIGFCDDEGNSAIVVAKDAAATERLGRALTMAMGGVSYQAKLVPRDVERERVLIPGSYSRARAIGLALRRAQQEGEVRAIALDALGGRVLFAGVIRDVERETSHSSMKGVLTVAGQGDGYSGTLRVEFQTEYLLAWYEGALLAATPDAISLIDAEIGEPVSTDGAQPGLRVVVLRLEADARLTTPEALRRLGPAAFGYDAGYRISG